MNVYNRQMEADFTRLEHYYTKVKIPALMSLDPGLLLWDSDEQATALIWNLI